MIHPGLNNSEIAERYYKKLGKFTTRNQAKKNFGALKKPNIKLVIQILEEIYEESLICIYNYM